MNPASVTPDQPRVRTFHMGGFSVAVQDGIILERDGQAFDGFRVCLTDREGETGDWESRDYSESVEDVAREMIAGWTGDTDHAPMEAPVTVQEELDALRLAFAASTTRFERQIENLRQVERNVQKVREFEHQRAEKALASLAKLREEVRQSNEAGQAAREDADRMGAKIVAATAIVNDLIETIRSRKITHPAPELPEVSDASEAPCAP